MVGSKGGLRRGDKVSLFLVLKDKGWAGTKVELLARAPRMCFEPPDAVKGDLPIRLPFRRFMQITLRLRPSQGQAHSCHPSWSGPILVGPLRGEPAAGIMLSIMLSIMFSPASQRTPRLKYFHHMFPSVLQVPSCANLQLDCQSDWAPNPPLPSPPPPPGAGSATSHPAPPRLREKNQVIWPGRCFTSACGTCATSHAAITRLYRHGTSIRN